MFRVCGFFLIVFSFPLFAGSLNPIVRVSQSQLEKCQNYKENPTTSTPYKITPKVDVISGNYIEDEVDLIIAGCEPLSLRRFYHHLSPYEPRYGNWHYNPETFACANLEYEKSSKFVAIGMAGGAVHSLENGQGAMTPGNIVKGRFSFDLSKQKHLMSKNGQEHPQNIKFSYQKQNDESFIYRGEIIDGTGTRRLFETQKYSWMKEIRVYTGERSYGPSGQDYEEGFAKLTPDVWTPFQLLVTEEKKPNGNIICYTYESWHDEEICPRFRLLSSITAYNATKTKILGGIKFKYKKGEEVILDIEANGSDGRKAQFFHGGEPYVLNRALTPNEPEKSYDYQGTSITQVKENGNSFLKTTYYKDSKKVSAQFAPVGPNGEMVPISQYFYHNGYTEVFDAEGHKTVYRYDANKKLTAVELYNGKELYKVDRSTWDVQTGNLLTHTVENGKGQVLLKQEYAYDKNHNPIKETLTDGEESYTLFRTYSEDGFNLLLSETDGGPKKVCYNYLSNTNLIAQEFVYDRETICRRTFYTYDDSAVCIKKIIDDGNSTNPNDLKNVTYRKILVIQPKKDLPCIGLPEVVEERTIDASGNEILLNKVIYSYTPFGKISREQHYDATNTLRYTLYNEYNAKEQLISSTDPLGYKTRLSYDGNHNLIGIEGPRKNQKKQIIYDKVNRPIAEIQTTSGGKSIKKQLFYDKLGNKIREIDECGFETRFSYDFLGREIAIIHPDGSCIKKEYDHFGNVIQETDAKGYEKKTTYNFRGKPICISYPDGTQESFTYHKTGSVASHQDKNGALTTYSYDTFDRPVEAKTYSQEGRLLRNTSSTYSALALLSTTDAEGFTTSYCYDFAGRKISETKGDKTIDYSYDEFGRPKRIKHAATVLINEYNLSGKVIREVTEDHEGNLLREVKFAYDEAGNQIQVINSKGAIEKLYDDLGHLIQIKDAMGEITQLEYLYDRGLIIKETNPKQIQTIHRHNALGQEIEVEKLTPDGKTIQKTTQHYDPNGNLIESIHHVFSNATFLKTISNKWQYGPCDRLEKSIESETKETKYVYDNKGRLQTKIKPDKQELHRLYDELGRLLRYYSTDFDYHYTYDKNDKILAVSDEISKTTTLRSYDIFGNVTSETLGSNLLFSSQYDAQGRRKTLILPDTSCIEYSYQGDRFHKIRRKNDEHVYSERDLEGNILQMSLAKSSGNVRFNRDAASRLTLISAPHFTSSLEYDVTGNITSSKFADPLGTFTSGYAYDDLDQLISENNHTYLFDSLSNRIKKDDHDHIVNNLNQILSDGISQYEYDENGNLICDGQTRFEYDSQDRLVKVHQPNKTITYTYDPFHRRLSKQVNKQSKELFLWDGDLEIGSCTTSKVINELRVLGEGLGAEIGAAVLLELHGKSYIPLHDHRGCIVVLLDPEKQKPLETYRYTAFGEALTPSKLSPWRFLGKRTDAETGFIFFGRRYYSSNLGRWMSPDPEGFHDGPNLYAYCHNKPLTRIDLFGLRSNPYANTRNICGFFNRTRELIFRGVEMIGKHLIPLPGLRDFVEATGRWGAGGRFWELAEYRKNFSRVHTVPGKDDPRGLHCIINGMNRTFEQALSQAQERAKEDEGYKQFLFYNGTKGFVTDLIECLIAKMGILCGFERMCFAMQTAYLDRNLDKQIFMCVHSQGATHMMNIGNLMDKHYRLRIAVEAIGPATFIPYRFFLSAVNYVSMIDFVPFLNPHVHLASVFNKGCYDIRYLKPTSCNPLAEHDSQGDTYRNALNKNRY